MKKNKLFMGLMIFVVLLTMITACGESEEPKVVVASKPHAEQYILGEMISILIEEHTDIEVERKFGIGGGTANIHPGMIAGEIDIYPEYTGTGWMAVLGKELIQDPQELYEETKTAYLEEFNIHWTGMYGFNNTYAIAIALEKAELYDIYTYSDLGEHSEKLVFGANYDFYERPDGYPGLIEVYQWNFSEEVELDIGIKYLALGQGEVDVINGFSTDGLLEAYDVRVLEDDLGFFPSYHAATLIRGEILERHPELESVLEKLTGMITDEEMSRMNYLMEEENLDEKEIAKDFLREKGLLP